jgi:hypothetical protein
MTKVDLREKPVTVHELLQLASSDVVVIVNQDGNEFVLEAADAFDREAAQLGASTKFVSFLAERAREPGSLSLEDVERRVNSEPEAKPAE